MSCEQCFVLMNAQRVLVREGTDLEEVFAIECPFQEDDTCHGRLDSNECPLVQGDRVTTFKARLEDHERVVHPERYSY